MYILVKIFDHSCICIGKWNNMFTVNVRASNGSPNIISITDYWGEYMNHGQSMLLCHHEKQLSHDRHVTFIHPLILLLQFIIYITIDGEWVKVDEIYVGLKEKREFFDTKDFLIDSATPSNLIVRFCIAIAGTHSRTLPSQSTNTQALVECVSGEGRRSG